MNLNGSGLKPLAPLAQFHHDLWATYSPDGKKISFVSDRFSNDITEFTYGTFDIITMNADGTNLTDIVAAAGFCPFDGPRRDRQGDQQSEKAVWHAVPGAFSATGFPRMH